jgi:hypothetical protein
MRIPVKHAFHYLSLIIMITMLSCVPGKKAARSFVQQKGNISLMMVPPGFISMNYYPVFPDFLAEEDTLYSLDDSSFLKEIDLEKGRELFLNALIHGLEKVYRLKVYTPDDFDEFLSQPDPRFIFSLAQAEVMEYGDVFEHRALIDTLMYLQTFPVRTVEKSNWFEFVMVDDTEEEINMQVLFSYFKTSDVIDGRFRYQWLSGEVTYEYSSYPMAVTDVYELFRTAGRQNAAYIFDFLLNRYVAENTHSKGNPVFLKYNPIDKSIRKDARATGFIILGE